MLDPPDDFKKPDAAAAIEGHLQGMGDQPKPSTSSSTPAASTKIGDDSRRRGALVPGTADNVPLRADHDVSRCASHGPADGRTGRSHSAIVHSDRATGWAETNLASLDPQDNPRWIRTKATSRDRSRLRRRGRACQGDPAAQKKDGEEQRRSPRRASRPSATRTSRPTHTSGIEGNRDLFMNTVNWLAQQESLIAIRPKEPPIGG